MCNWPTNLNQTFIHRNVDEGRKVTGEKGKGYRVSRKMYREGKYWAGRKTAIMAMTVPQFPLLLLILCYVMYYM